MWMTIMAVQAAVAGPPASYDLANAPKPRPCERTAGDDIVVCGGKGGDQYRLKPLTRQLERPMLPKAEVGVLGKGKLSAETESAGVGGFTSKRAMVRLKIPF